MGTKEVSIADAIELSIVMNALWNKKSFFEHFFELESVMVDLITPDRILITIFKE